MSWAPDIYNLEKVKGNRMLVTTATANKLIADVWFARADFAKDNPDIMEGLVRGIFDAMEDLKAQEAKQKVAKLMAAGYSIPESDALGMLGDAHSTNYAENREFFLNQNNPTNFERTWNTAYFLYKKISAVTQQTPFDQVMDFSVIQKLGSEAEVREPEERVRRPASRRPAPASIQGEKRRDPDQDGRDPLLPELMGSEQEGHARRSTARTSRSSTTRTSSFVVEEVGKLAGQYGAARIVIEGHTDGSMRGQVPKSAGAGAVAQSRQLGEGSDRRASSRRCSRTSSPRPGIGWDQPADPTDPDNHAKNRRVEIKVYPAEAGAAK